jgi:hypothetical protein
VDALTHVLRTNSWASIAVSLVLAAVLIAVGQTQLASLLACIGGTLLMWKSERDHRDTAATLEAA